MQLFKFVLEYGKVLPKFEHSAKKKASTRILLIFTFTIHLLRRLLGVVETNPRCSSQLSH
jgi:hypothetical protein